MALGTWSAIVSRTMLKYELISLRMSSVSRASLSVKAGSFGFSPFSKLANLGVKFDRMTYENIGIAAILRGCGIVVVESRKWCDN